MPLYAVIDSAGNVVNRIELESDSVWMPPAGSTIVAEDATPFEIGGTYLAGVYTPPAPDTSSLIPAPPQSVLSQDLMAQFTAADAALIQTAVASDAQFWLLWSALQAQKDPMLVTNARFLAGWSALITVLGAPRMTAIATALGVTVA